MYIIYLFIYNIYVYIYVYPYPRIYTDMHTTRSPEEVLTMNASSFGYKTIAQRRRGCSLSVFVSMGNNSLAPGRAHEHSYFITRSTNVTAIRVSVTIS